MRRNEEVVDLTDEEVELAIWALGYVEGALEQDKRPTALLTAKQAGELVGRLKEGR